MNKYLFISNGLGEDSITLSIIRALKRIDSESLIYALPIVGSGASYESVKCEILGTREAMPSGGVIPGNLGNLINDFKSGLAGLTIKQISIIREFSGKVGAIATVGDIYPALLAALFGGRTRKIMIATAKSDYVSPHNAFEKHIMKSCFEKVFLRDAHTAESLFKSGVKNAVFAGNAMMDCLEPEGIDFLEGREGPLVAVLPGSRKSAILDIPVIAGAVERLTAEIGGVYASVIPPSISPSALAEASGWSFDRDRNSMRNGSAEIVFHNSGMPDLLRACSVVIGQAGTANEQAAGLGKPVVAFDSFSDDKMGWYRMRQKGLLGDAVSVVRKDSDAVASEILSIMGDSEKYEAMSAEGRCRLGKPGGAMAMAESMLGKD